MMGIALGFLSGLVFGLGTLVFLPAMLGGLWPGSHGKDLSILIPKGAF